MPGIEGPIDRGVSGGGRIDGDSEGGTGVRQGVAVNAAMVVTQLSITCVVEVMDMG